MRNEKNNEILSLEELIKVVDGEITESKIKINNLIISGKIKSFGLDTINPRIMEIFRAYRKELKLYRNEINESLKKLKNS